MRLASPDTIDFNIQCTYTPALFKVESILLHRIHHLFMDDSVVKGTLEFSNKFKALETSILELQQAYQQDDQDTTAALWAQLRKMMDIVCNIHNQEPIGRLTFI